MTFKRIAACLLLLSLIPAWVFAQGSKPDYGRTYNKLFFEWNGQYKIFMAKFNALKTDAEREKFDWSKDPTVAFRAKFWNLASQAKGTLTEETALTEVWNLSRIGISDSKMLSASTQRLIDKFPHSKAMINITGQLAWAYPFTADQSIAMLRMIIAKNPSGNINTAAEMALAQNLSQGPAPIKAHSDEARSIYRRIVAESPDSSSGKQAAASLFEMDHLQVGMIAPEFDAVDESGNPWKLSDYHGKVVVLDFWGFW